jgi:hypothetical protein
MATTTTNDMDTVPASIHAFFSRTHDTPSEIAVLHRHDAVAAEDDAVAADDEEAAVGDDMAAADDGVFPVRDDYISIDEENVIVDDVYTVVDLRDDGESVCYLEMMAGEPAFKSTLTLAKKCAFNDNHKKDAMEDYYGHLCPDKHLKSKNFKVCLSCLIMEIDKNINMGEKNPSCEKVVQHLRQDHLYDGVYTAFKAIGKALAVDAAKPTFNKMSQWPITTFPKNHNIVKKTSR